MKTSLNKLEPYFVFWGKSLKCTFVFIFFNSIQQAEMEQQWMHLKNVSLSLFL